MADVPFPLTGETLDDLRMQLQEIIRLLYEEKIGGADLGDVFSITGEVLTLMVNADGGLEKSSNAIQLNLLSTGGLSADEDGTTIKLKTGSGLTVDADGLYITVVAGLTGSKTWDVGELADNGEATTTCTVTGASLGDTALAGLTSLDEVGWEIHAMVSSADTVCVRITNRSGGTIDPASGTLNCIVWAA